MHAKTRSQLAWLSCVLSAQVQVWDVAGSRDNTATPSCRMEASARHSVREFEACAVSPGDAGCDTLLLAAGSPNRGCRTVPVLCFDVRAGKEVAALQGHGSTVNQLRFDSCSGLLCSASSDGTAKIWDLRMRAVLATLFGHRGGVRSCAFMRVQPKKGVAAIVTGGYDRTVRSYTVDPCLGESFGAAHGAAVVLEGSNVGARLEGSMLCERAGYIFSVASGSWCASARVYRTTTPETFPEILRKFNH